MAEIIGRSNEVVVNVTAMDEQILRKSEITVEEVAALALTEGRGHCDLRKKCGMASIATDAHIAFSCTTMKCPIFDKPLLRWSQSPHRSTEIVGVEDNRPTNKAAKTVVEKLAELAGLQTKMGALTEQFKHT